MNVFIKKLKNQESGYSGDKPDQRGKYILIPAKSWGEFPHLSETQLNHTKIIKLYTKEQQSIALNIVYHNAKFFPTLGLSRDHNEIRVYRNKSIDDALSLDRNVIIVMIRLSNNEYYIDSIQENDDDYQDFDELLKECIKNGKLGIEKLKTTERFFDLSNIKKSDKEVENIGEIISSTSKYVKSGSAARKQQDHHPDDPSGVFSTLIKSQNEFASFIREIYGNKCAIRGTSLIDGHHAGLEAAHIKAAQHGGPLLPSNGVLMSSDLHKCFDQGFFSFNDDNEIIISPKVPINSELYQFEGLKIEPNNLICAPFYEYNKHHRNEHEIPNN
ncbi:hypothetical protein BCV02_15795 [Vibrio breoganii]|uniref:HNH endonuclease n=1 Tax=Vibrio breoganii TaxID=553239 RepID=UPI000CC9315C|nr:HNH endonuclease [Vibrio breoganii]PMF99913.1 hypothetical protein BCV02_15795 [Vibrio breoganii]